MMEKYWSDDFYNPSAVYKEGQKVKKSVSEWRTKMSRALGVSPTNIVFTSGGTESDNLAILGAFEAFRQAQDKKPSDIRPHIIVSAIEHPSIMACANEVERRGGKVTVLDVDEEGQIDLEELEKSLDKNTFLVSITLANGEIGTVAPVVKVGRIVREYRKEHGTKYPYLHTDASQAPSYLNVSPETLYADMLTLDGAKIYGPKGIGALVVRKGIDIHPVIFGGDQEGGRRAGTLSPALIAGFVQALELVIRDRDKEAVRLEGLRKYFIEKVSANCPSVVINTPAEHLPNIVSVSIPGALGEFLLLKLDAEGVMGSVGTACSLDGKESGSPALKAIGKEDLAESTLRFSFGRFTTKSDMDEIVKIFCRIAKSVVK